MASVNLLGLVQEVIYDIGSDVVVADVTDTEESKRIARLIKNTYEYLEVERDWGHKYRQFLLTAATNSSIVELTIPAAVTKIDRIDYKVPIPDTSNIQWRELEYLEPKDFFDRLGYYDDDDTNLATEEVEDPDTTWPTSGIDFYIKTDKDPEYWTSIEDKYIVFDSVDTDTEANIDASKARAWGYIQYTIDPTDDTQTIEVPDSDFQLFRATVFAAAHAKIRQANDPVSTAQARRLRIRAQKEGNSLTPRPKHTGVNYGRS